MQHSAVVDKTLHFFCCISMLCLFINMHIFRERREIWGKGKKRCFMSSEFTRCPSHGMLANSLLAVCFSKFFFFLWVCVWYRRYLCVFLYVIFLAFPQHKIGINKNFNYFLCIWMVRMCCRIHWIESIMQWNSFWELWANVFVWL